MRQKFERYAVIAVLAASPLWLSSVPDSLGSSLRLRVADLFKPAIAVVDSFTSGFERVVFGVFQWPFLQEENRLLRKQVETFQAHERTHQELADENMRLRVLLQMKGATPWRLLPAEVARREFNNWSRTLLIDRGTRDGVRPGMAVIASGGLVGRIADAGKSMSRVLLLNDPQFRISAIASNSRVMGLVMGNAAGGVVATYIPLDSQMKAGEPIVSTGGASFCPSGVPIGMVSSFSEDPSHLYLSAKLHTAVNLSTVEEVMVILWPFSDSGS